MRFRIGGVGDVDEGRTVTDGSHIEPGESGFLFEFASSGCSRVLVGLHMSTRSAPTEGAVPYEDGVASIG
jgi:hypothetical protein